MVYLLLRWNEPMLTDARRERAEVDQRRFQFLVEAGCFLGRGRQVLMRYSGMLMLILTEYQKRQVLASGELACAFQTLSNVEHLPHAHGCTSSQHAFTFVMLFFHLRQSPSSRYAGLTSIVHTIRVPERGKPWQLCSTTTTYHLTRNFILWKYSSSLSVATVNMPSPKTSMVIDQTSTGHTRSQSHAHNDDDHNALATRLSRKRYGLHIFF